MRREKEGVRKPSFELVLLGDSNDLLAWSYRNFSLEFCRFVVPAFRVESGNQLLLLHFSGRDSLVTYFSLEKLGD